ncbi:MAG: hypothetical protein OEV44_04700, partial [Spirochaetota bacterium]|nr:hypothetical protein [Spirochaetota bacterium]
MAIINSDNLDQSEKEELVFKIKNELNEYFKFVDLLQKSRSTKSTRLIEEYIKKESNILRRINFIEELDREQRFADRVEPQVDAEEIRIAKQKIEKRKISFNLTPSSFLTYLFSTRKSIKNFGLRTGIIESGIFSLRMTGHSEFHYKNLIVGVNSLLIKSVNYILENGWMKLDRRSYNTVVIFSRYLKQFFQAGNIINRDDNKLIFKNLEQFISPYLQVVSKRIYKDLLKESFYEVLYFEPSFKSKFRDMVNLLDEILNTESRGTCFFNIVMGIIIIKFRNFVKFSDLLDHYNIQDIEDTKYDFSPKVRQQIQDKLDSLEFKYKEAEEKLFFLRFVGEDLSLDAKENNPLTQIFGKVY